MGEITESKEWQHLKKHRDEIAGINLRDLFAADPKRFSRYSVKFGDILLDYSKNFVTQSTIPLLNSLADRCELTEKINAMFNGRKINFTESRAVLHTALRDMSGREIIVDRVNISPLVRGVQERMKTFVKSVHSGDWLSSTGQRFTDAVNIGIGGSDLGPAMVCTALQPYARRGINLHFVSNVDAADIVETLKVLNPDTTLFIIASKTFTTQETLANARTAREWFLSGSGRTIKDVARHFVALSTNAPACADFGIPKENMFEFWDWVGGRYSLWSAIGLSIALSCGWDAFEDLLQGGFEMDEHFRSAPFEENMPVILGLLTVWYVNFFGTSSHAVIPYDSYLEKFPAFLQQLDMESNGKRTDAAGNFTDYATGPVVWGTTGTNAQHSYFQLLHQSNRMIPADFLAPAISHNPIGKHHAMLLSNFFAQTEALMRGKTREEVLAELEAAGTSPEKIELLLPHKIFPGNKPSNSIMYKKLTPKTLGSLIALYEHKVFVCGAIWNINSFDQWGVELGKQLAGKILPELETPGPVETHDSSTNGLINFYKSSIEN